MPRPQAGDNGGGNQDKPSNYVPGYGYVDPNDPGTSGSVEPGSNAYSTMPSDSGQRPYQPPPPQIIYVPPPQPYVPKWWQLEDDTTPPPTGVLDFREFTDIPRPEGVLDQASYQDPRTEMAVRAGIRGEAANPYNLLAENLKTGSKQLAQEVAAANNGIVVQEGNYFTVLYGEEAAKEIFRRAIYDTEASGDRDNYGARDSWDRKYEDVSYVGSTWQQGKSEVFVDAERAEQERRLAATRNYMDVNTITAIPYSPEGVAAEPDPVGNRIYDDQYWEAKERGLLNLVFWEKKSPLTFGTTGGTVTDVFMDARTAKDYTQYDNEVMDQIIDLTKRYYQGMPMQPSWIEKRWSKAVDAANRAWYLRGEKVTPFEVYERMLTRWKADKNEGKGSGGGGGYYSGGYGGYGGGGYGGGGGQTQTQTTIRLTSPTDARVILNQAMEAFLGRQATVGELEEFIRMLNSKEKSNPIVTTLEYGADGTSSTQTQEGGVNPQAIAETFAKAQEGSAEYQGTLLMDAMIGVLSGNTGVL